MRVELVCTNQTPPAILQAVATWFDGGTYKVRLDSPESAAPSPGDRVILDFGQNEFPRVLTVVTERDSDCVTLSVKRSQPRDKREFPRMHGGIQLRYTAVSPGDQAAVSDWYLRGEAPKDARWSAPDPFMDFSASGLKFEDIPACADDDLLLMEVTVPTSEGHWRGVAQVVRVSPIAPDEIEVDSTATHHVAVEFQSLPTEAIEALMTFTLNLQGALL